jgi:phage protein D
MAQTNVSLKVKLAGQEVTSTDLHDLSVEADLDQPDMAAVVLTNKETKYGEKINLGDDVVIEGGFVSGMNEEGTIFKGEVTGLEPMYDTKAPMRLIVRALNKLHLLARGKKSVAYTKVTDKDIVDKICQLYSLQGQYGDAPPTVQYDHVYQHNQTDLEFVRLRAARIGFEVFVQDTKLYFRKRSEQDSGITLELGVSGENLLEKFHPRLSTANQVSEVRVRAWDPDQKKEIIGTAKASGSKLGQKTGTQVAENAKHSNILAVDVDVPVFSKEQADGIAKSILQDRLMNFITGDAVTKGNPNIKPGIVLSLKTNQDKRFDGKYYVTSVRHNYVHDGPDQGFRTFFKFKRDASDA